MAFAGVRHFRPGTVQQGGHAARRFHSPAETLAHAINDRIQGYVLRGVLRGVTATRGSAAWLCLLSRMAIDGGGDDRANVRTDQSAQQAIVAPRPLQEYALCTQWIAMRLHQCVANPLRQVSVRSHPCDQV